jgi:uncharacterized membrane protein YdbT with pleckstrin-like domain
MDLTANEKELWSGRPTWRAILSYYIKWTFLALIPGVGGQVLSSLGVDDVPLLLTWGASVILIGLVLLVGWLRRLATQYTITNERLHIRRGILSRRQYQTSTDRIQNVNTHQSALDRMLNVGDVDFDTAGTEDSSFMFGRIADPHALVHLVANLQDQREAGPPPTQHGL